MKNFYYPIIILFIHFIGWGKLLFDHPQLWVVLLWGGTIGLFVTYRNELRQLPFLLMKLPLKDTIFPVIIQGLFLCVLIMTKNIPIQLLAMAGILICELFRMLRYPAHVQDKHIVSEYVNKLEEMNQHFLIVRSQRHDFLKHVSTMDYLIDKNADLEVKGYFRHLLGEYEEINHTMKGEDAHISAILLKYKQEAERTGTKVIYKLDRPVSKIPMQQTNQVELVTNLLENAVEAARSYHEKMHSSILEFHTDVHGGIYILTIKNSAFFEDQRILENLFEKFEVTSKGEQHQGLGTFIISSLVRSHSGRLSYQYLNDQLTIKVKLPLIERDKKW